MKIMQFCIGLDRKVNVRCALRSYLTSGGSYVIEVDRARCAISIINRRRWIASNAEG